MTLLIVLIVLTIVTLSNALAIHWAAMLANAEQADYATTLKTLILLNVLMVFANVAAPGAGAPTYAPLFFSGALLFFYVYTLVNKLVIKGASNIVIFVGMSAIFTFIFQILIIFAIKTIFVGSAS